MRVRTIGLLSTTALAALALAGCSSSGDDAAATATATPSATAAALCDSAAPSGDAVEAVTVEGDAGTPSEATFTAPLEVSELQSTVVSEGDGDAIADGDWLNYAYTAYNAETGEKLDEVGYEDGSLLPLQVSSDSVGFFTGCGAIGTRVIGAQPSSTGDDGTTYPAVIFVFDEMGLNPTAAWGEDQDPEDGFPTVTLAEDGTPTVDITGVTASDTTQVETLKLGDGATVADGDTVLVQYDGISLADGNEFDSSWANGTPVSFSTSGVITGFTTALVGQTVGSQVVAIIPAAEAYGAEASDDVELSGQDLVFVIDILATQHAAS
ncbi:MAG: FKBP-type peptidyl-prolyl cis-trans isomerase [Microbacterium sp.]